MSEAPAPSPPAAPAVPVAETLAAPVVAATPPAPLPVPEARVATPKSKEERLALVQAAIAAKKNEVVPPPAAAPEPAPAAAAPAAETPPPAQPQSPALAALAKREAELREREAALKASESKTQQQAALLADPDVGRRLAAVGLTLEQVLDYNLNGNRPTEDMRKSAMESEVKRELAEVKKAIEDRAKAEQSAALEHGKAQYRSAILAEAAKAGEKYELVVAKGEAAAHKAVEIFAAYTQKYGEPPAMSDVLAAVDRYYEDEAAPLLTTKRFKSKLAPVVSEPVAPQAASQTGPRREVSRTLTNSSVAAPPATRKPTTRDERLAAAAEAFKRGRNGG